MSALERVLTALRDHGCAVRITGGQHRARCPAHNGSSNNSLGVRGIQDRVLLFCHGGCDVDDILDALELVKTDLFDKPRIDYDYPDGRVVHRSPNKQFWQSGNTTGKALYRLPEVQQAVQNSHVVYVVEGEQDVHAIESVGGVATTSPQGAKNWSKVDASPLHGARVVVVGDNDDTGQQYVHDVTESLRDKAASFTVMQAKVGKDVSDHLTAGYELDDLVQVDTHDPLAEIANLYQPIDWAELFTSGADEVDWLVDNYLLRGRSYVTFSPAKMGKSLLALDVAAALASGRSALGYPAKAPMRVLYVDIENTRGDILERLLDMGYEADQLGNLKYFSFPSLPMLDTERGGTHLLALATQHQAELVIIDTVSRVVGGEENAADTFQDLYRYAITPLKARGVTVNRLDHTGKDLDRGQRGSSAKTDDVDAAWKLTGNGTDFVLRCEIQRSAHHPEKLALRRETDPVLRHVTDDSYRSGAPTPRDRELAQAIEDLDTLNVPIEAGRDRARKILTGAGIRVGNVVLTDALKQRKLTFETPQFLSPQDQDRSDSERSPNLSAQDQDSFGENPGQTCPGQVPDRSRTGISSPQGEPVRRGGNTSVAPPGTGLSGPDADDPFAEVFSDEPEGVQS